MTKQLISTEKAPAAIGPYNQAVKIDGFIFVSGQLPIDMTTGELVKDDIKAAAISDQRTDYPEGSGGISQRCCPCRCFHKKHGGFYRRK